MIELLVGGYHIGSVIEPSFAIMRAVLGKDYERQDCSIARALEVVGERWTMLIVRDAFFGVKRFSDFQAHLDIPKAVLSERLSGLVQEGVLERKPDPAHSGRHLYELTRAGRELWPVLYELLSWGGRHRHPNSRLFRHAACGSALGEHGTCPTCGYAPRPEDISMELRRGRGRLRDDPVTVALRAPKRLLDPVEV
jgi:DNA-binding HxlR family transcriptional regulator